MSAFGGPNPIVTNGLIFALDVGDPRSYVSGSTTWYDLSGNGNHAFLSQDGITTASFDSTYSFENSAPYFFSGSPLPQSTSVDNTDGKMWVINGTPDMNVNNTGEWTVSGWVAHRDEGSGSFTNNGTGWFTKGTDQRVHVEFLGPNLLRINTRYAGESTGSGWSMISKNITEYLGTFTHYTVTYRTNGVYGTDIGDMNLYVNGSLTNTRPGVPLIDNDSYDIWLGRRNGHMKHFQGADITSYQFYNRSLSETEIQQNYNSQKDRFNL
jgi:hypothetical protein